MPTRTRHLRKALWLTSPIPLRYAGCSAAQSAGVERVGDTAKGFLIIAAHEGLKALPIDACSGVGAMMAKDASRRYAKLDARARENSKQIRPEEEIRHLLIWAV